MSGFGIFAGLLSFIKLKNNGIKLITDWRHENTLRQQLCLQAGIEHKKLEVEKMRFKNEAQKIKLSDEDSKRLASLEQTRIETLLLQQDRQNKMEILKILIERELFSETESAKFISHITNNHNDDHRNNLTL